MTFIHILLVCIAATLIVIARELRPIAAMRRKDLLRQNQREFVIGFGPTVIKKGAIATFVAKPTINYKGTRLIVPSVLANGFSVTEIKAGSQSSEITANPIPAAAFSELAVGVDIGLCEVRKGDEITLSVANTQDRDATFSAAMIGLTDRPTPGAGGRISHTERTA